MDIFVTGATGYIGGSMAVAMIEAGHTVYGLVRSESRASQVREFGIEPILGTLDDPEILATAANRVDAVINCALSDHRGAVTAMLDAMEGSGKIFLQSSGTSVFGRPDRGERCDAIFSEDTPYEPSPGRIERYKLNNDIIAAANRGIRTVVLFPPLIYGEGRGVNSDSIHVPWLLRLAEKTGIARHIGPGENIWSTVHIDDLTDLYQLALQNAPAGTFYFAENGEVSIRDICIAINKMMGVDLPPEPMMIEEAMAEWGENHAEHTMASNSRIRSKRAQEELGWSPHAPSLMEELATGCYSPKNL